MLKNYQNEIEILKHSKDQVNRDHSKCSKLIEEKDSEIRKMTKQIIEYKSNIELDRRLVDVSLARNRYKSSL